MRERAIQLACAFRAIGVPELEAGILLALRAARIHPEWAAYWSEAAFVGMDELEVRAMEEFVRQLPIDPIAAPE